LPNRVGAETIGWFRSKKPLKTAASFIGRVRQQCLRLKSLPDSPIPKDVLPQLQPLKKIHVDQVRLGMHIHELCGPWIDHPFWKTKFVLGDSAELTKLQGSGVKECWIDVTKGLDVAQPVGEAPAATMPRPLASGAIHADTVGDEQRAAHAARQQPATLSQEVQRAAALYNQSRAAVTSLFSEARLGNIVDASGCEELITEIADSVWRNPAALLSLARLKTHDDYTYMHSMAVAALMAALARQLGLDHAQVRLAAKAGLLHDMGKAMMPIEVLNKPGKLTGDEYAIMKLHPERGHELLVAGTVGEFEVLDVCLHHHERPDGAGYPHGLKDEQISLFARMGAVCDVYDAITSNRPYKDGWDPAESIARMAGWAKGQFDPVVFKAFVTSLGIYPIGSLVRLKSGLLAVVTQQNPAALTAPEVKAFFSTTQGLHISPRLIDLSVGRCKDAIVGRESNSTWKFTHLDALWAGEDVLRKVGL
jgi:putative nucleotidyltransferase with HDIG domain